MLPVLCATKVSLRLLRPSRVHVVTTRTQAALANGRLLASVIPGKRHKCHAVSIDNEQQEDETVAEGDYCMPGDVVVDNDSNDTCTVLSVQVKDYPGLFRVLAWVINGLDLVVEHAEIDTTSEGYAANTFWLKNRKRCKLSKPAADLLAERVTDYVRYCTPDTTTLCATHFRTDMVEVMNDVDEQYTVALICPPKGEDAALLNVASTLTGIGLAIRKACIAKQDGNDPVSQQTYKFWLTNVQGQKLDYGDITSMMYTLKLVWAKNHIFSTSPPLTAPFAAAAGKVT